MKKNAKKIIIRADGSKRIGMGHIYRNIFLSKYIRKYYNYEIVFITRNNKATQDLLDRNHFKYFLLQFNISRKAEIENIRDILKTEKPNLIIIDVLKSCFDKTYMNTFRYRGNVCVVAFIDSHRKSILNADIVFNTSPYQKNIYYKDIKNTQYYLGFDYLILPEEYVYFNKKNSESKPVPKIIICMGGADQQNLTFKILKAIDKSRFNFECDIVLSSIFFKKTDVDKILEGIYHKTRIHYDVKSLYELLRTADLAITAGGYSLVERLCAGVPGIVINQLVHQEKYSRAIMERGATVDLGLYKNVSTKNIFESFNMLMKSPNLRKNISQRGIQLVDGKGMENICQIIFKHKNFDVRQR